MAELNMTRDMVKAQLSEIRPQMMAMFAAQKEGISLYGEEIKIPVPSGVRKAMHYASGKNQAPVYIDVHGGGYTWGTISDGDAFCHEINETFGWEVYTMDYPLTPDEEYPFQLNWVYETICYLREHAAAYHIDPDRIVIGGRSAGGNLSAALCLKAKETGDFQFAAQILDHPWLDMCGIISWDGDARYKGEETLSAEVMTGLAWGYADLPQLADKLVSPLAATIEELKGLPPAIIQTCEEDSLRPEGDLYAEHLEEAGVKVIHHCFPGAVHGFTEGTEPIGEEGRAWIIEQLKRIVDF